MHYVVDTEAEALAEEAKDYADELRARAITTIGEGASERDIEAKIESQKEKTSCWDVPKQRLDGKWIWAFCPHSTATGRKTETDPQDGTWFPLDGE